MKVSTCVKIIMLAAGILLAVSCNHNAAKTVDSNKAAAAPATELPLPQVPESLTSPEQRADYLALHFWDGMQWHNRAMALDTVFMEQNFANFVPVLGYTTTDGLIAAVSTLLDAAHAAGPQQTELLLSVAEKYLYQADSPMREESLFMPFAEWAVANGVAPERNGEIRKDILKNAPGNMAPDFAFTLRDGRNSRLSNYHGTPLLVMFYEPDCQECLAAEKEMTQSQKLAAALQNGELRLLMVYIGDDRALWSKHAATLPVAWDVAIADPTALEELYNVRATPSFYLLGADGKILRKDASLATLM